MRRWRAGGVDMGLLVVKPWLGFVVFITIDVNLITNIGTLLITVSLKQFSTAYLKLPTFSWPLPLPVGLCLRAYDFRCACALPLFCGAAAAAAGIDRM